MRLNANRVGLVLGLFIAGLHILWSIIVAIGWGQALVNFISWLHMVNISEQVTSFDFTAAAFLVILSFVVGYAIGWAFSILLNKLYKA